MVSRVSLTPGQKSALLVGMGLMLLIGQVHLSAQTSSASPASGTSASSAVFKVHRQVLHGPVRPTNYPTRPQQEVRKLR